ncbi:NAD(P)-binding domain-containing protein [soil metagenome]
MQIAIIGTGNVARILTPRLVEAGHAVTLGSRQPDEHSDSPVPVFGLREAIDAAGVIVNATPGRSSVEELSSIGAEAYDGKTLIDVGNAVNDSWELVYPHSSLAEELQKALPGAHVVKTLNTAAITVLADRSLVGGGGTVFVSSDHEEAKATTREFLAAFGWDADSVIDLGALVSARGAEHYFMMFAAVMRGIGTPTFNIQIVR